MKTFLKQHFMQNLFLLIRTIKIEKYTNKYIRIFKYESL